MFEQIRNIDAKEFLRKKIEKNVKIYGKVIVRAVLFREEDSIYLYHGKINFQYKSETPPSNFSHDYGNVILLQSIMNVEEFFKLLESLTTENIVLNEFKNIKMEGGFIDECYHIANRYKLSGIINDWPCWFSRFSCNSNTIHFMEFRSSLTSTGLHPYPDLYEANRAFLDLDEDSSPNQNTPVGIQIIVPDYRARIKTLEIAENTITIIIENREIPIENLVLQFYCKNDKKTHSIEEIKIEKNGVSKITLPFVPKEGHAYLLEKNSGVKIDSKSFGRWYTDRTGGIIVKTSKETVESMIVKGETDTIEFKLDLGKDNNDFLESVVSFANSKGGTILLGIHDDSRIIGYDEDFDKVDKRIRNWVANKCEPEIDVVVEPVMIENKQIFAITVKEGKNKPYMLIGKSAYKRVIKDDYVMNRRDFDEIYSKRQNQQERLGIG